MRGHTFILICAIALSKGERTINSHSDPSKAPEICAADGSNGFLVAHEYCNKFYICNDGIPKAIKCFGNLNYNSNGEYCDWPANVDCGDRIISEGDGDDPSSDSGIVKDDPSLAADICAVKDSDGIQIAHENCNQYYKCSGGLPVAYKCQGHLFYDPSKEYCDCADFINCGDRYIPGSEDNENNESNDVGAGDNGNGNGDPSEASKICSKEEFNGAFVAHEKCNKFYRCSQSKPILIRCPGGLLFNPLKDVCDWPENVNCGDRIIPDPNENESSGDYENGDNGNDNGSGDNDNTDNENGNNGAGNYDPSEALKICSSTESEGVLVAHEKCNKFYTCSLGKPIPVRCPEGLLFNPALDVCDWPENVECGDRIIPDTSENGGSGDTEDCDNCNDNGSEDNDSTDNGNGDNDNEVGENGGHDNPSEAPAICAAAGSEGVLVAHENCNQFYVCYEGKPVVSSCQTNLLYNPKIEACDWPQNVKCGDRIIPEDNSEENESGIDSGNNGNETDNENDSNVNSNGGHDNPSEAPAICAAPGSEGVLVAHENCNQFYACYKGKPVTLDCPLNLLYNPKLQICDWPQNVKCGDRVIPKDDSEDNDIGDINTGDNDSTTENGNTDNGNGDNDNEDGENGSYDNPSEAPTICAATKSEGVLVAHENCNQYYVCSEGKPVVTSCQTNLLYNPRIKACDWPQNVKCGDRIIPEDDSEENDSEIDSGNNDNEIDNGNNDNETDNGNTDNENDNNDINNGDHDNETDTGNNDNETDNGNTDNETDNGNADNENDNNDINNGNNDNETDNGNNDNETDNGNNDNETDNGNNENDNNDINNGDNDNETDNGNNDNETDNGNNDNETGNGNNNNETDNDNTDNENDNNDINNGGNDNETDNGNNDDEPDNGNNDNETDNGNIDNENDNNDINNGDNDNETDNGNNDDETDTGNNDNETDNGNTDNETDNGNTDNENDNNDINNGDYDNVTDNGNNDNETDNGNNDNEIDNGNTDNDNDNNDINNGDHDNSSEGNDNDTGSGDNDTGNGDNDFLSDAHTVCAAPGSDGILIAHKHCNQLYLCSEGKPVVLDCPLNLLFNIATQQCEWQENVQCGNRVIPA